MDIAVDQLINKVGSLYKLVVLASRRAIELGEGAAKLVDVAKDVKPFNVALKEILDGKITYKAMEKEDK
ncbi:MAG: DNA-directed RNA polymerase subunit omega [Spirochaetales bacterium]|nr:MAG: DNA-directed RNA polymerase subunit omega [Spirochaetales bacterium]